MSFTVLGSSGTIGRHVVQYLRAQGEEIFTPLRNDETVYTRPLGHTIYAIGITSDFRTRAIDTVQAHVCVLAKLLQQAEFESLVYLSSTRVYAGQSSASEDCSFLLNPQNPSDVYNLSKLTGESLCLHCQREGVKIARLANVVGGDDHDSNNFIPSLLREAEQGCIVLRSDPASAKDYIHIDDVAMLLTRIAVSGRQKIYNVASGRQISHAAWLDRLTTLTGCSTHVLPDSPMQQFPLIDIRRINEEFYFHPKSVFDVLDKRNKT